MSRSARCRIKTEPRTQRSGVSGCFHLPLTPLRCVRGSDLPRNQDGLGFVLFSENSDDILAGIDPPAGRSAGVGASGSERVGLAALSPASRADLRRPDARSMDS